MQQMKCFYYIFSMYVNINIREAGINTLGKLEDQVISFITI